MIRNTLRGYVADAARAFDRAPVEVALALVTAVFISYAIEAEHVAEVALHFTVAAVLTGAVAWSATVLYGLRSVSEKRRWVFTSMGAAAGALYLLLVPELSNDAEAWRVLALLSAAALVILAVPGWAPVSTDANLRFRRINGRLLLRAAGISLYGLALFGGLALALLSINNLFELKLEEKIYLHVFVWIMIVLVPWVIVGGLDDYVQPLDVQSDVERAVHRLSRFLVPPLVAIYYLILIAYTIRIAMTGELPQNLVSPMVIAAGVLAAVALMLFDPAAGSAASMRWLRLTPMLYVLLAPLGVWALYARIDAYGWTEFRLLRLIVLGALLLLAILALVQTVRRQPYALRVAPALIALVLLISVIGPWSVLNVARRDQQHRLLDALRRAKVNLTSIPAANDSMTRVIPRALYVQINSTASYLASHFGESALPREIPETARRVRYTRPLADYYHLAPAAPDTGTQHYNGSVDINLPIQLAEGRRAYRISYVKDSKDSDRPRMSHDTLVMTTSGEQLFVPLAGALSAASTRMLSRRVLPAEAASAPVLDARGTVRGDLLILDMGFAESRKGREISSLQGVLLLNR